MTGERSINVTILDRQYKITVEGEKDEIVKTAERIINDKIKEYSDSYTKRDGQDLMAMIALQYVTLYLNHERDNKEAENNLSRRLDEINQMLDEQLL